MNATRALCAAASLLLTSLAGLANASDEWYMGTSASHYNLIVLVPSRIIMKATCSVFRRDVT